MKLILLLGALLGAPVLQASVVAEFFVDGEMNGPMQPGEPSDWQMRFYYMSTGEPVVDYMRMHAKYMHMVVVSRDLETFAHIHPDYDPEKGEFRITVNQATDDPDNFMLPRTVTKPGEHYVFTEVMLKESDHMIHGKHFTDAAGVPTPPLVQPFHPCDWQRKTLYLARGGVVQPDEAEYRVHFSCEPKMVNDFQSLKLAYAIEKKTGTVYQPYAGFEPWLEMAGHAMAIGYEGNSVGAVVFRHLHAMMPMNNILEFMLDPMHGSIDDGQYKLWSQFKIDGQIFTVAVPIDYRVEL